MAENTAIEWADHTFNPWIGCTKVSPACDHCYASVSTPARVMKIEWGPGAQRRRTAPSTWEQPKRWNAAHAEFFAQHGRRQRVFCASLADVFDNEVDPAWRRDLFALIEQTPNLDWLLLTKRIGNVKPMMIDVAASLFWMDELGTGALPSHVRLGATICDQEEADRDITKLMAVRAAKRFLSIEPMLGPVDLTSLPMNDTCASECCGKRRIDVVKGASYCGDTGRDPRDEIDEAENRIDWVIVGGESGPKARPMHPNWVRSLRDQCNAAGVPFFFKQWGEWVPIEVDSPGDGTRYAVLDDGSERDITTLHRSGRGYYEIHTFADGQQVARVGKEAAGRLLDGREWNEVPA